jgi:hypothetical protein
MRHLITTIAVCAVLPFASAAADDSFSYLTRVEDKLETLHSLPFVFGTDESWQVSEPTHRTANFNDVPFEVSLSAFIQADRAIMIHSEHVADNSGASNYTHFPATDWPVAGFRGNPPACGDLVQADVDEEHDLRWLDERGYSPVGSIWFEQHFLSGNNFNDEIVVSLLINAPSCDDADRPDAGLAEMRAALSVTPAVHE